MGDFHMSVSEAHKRATARYKKKHPLAAKCYQSHSYARRYINVFSDEAGLQELEELIHKRRQVLAEADDQVVAPRELDQQVGGQR